MVEAAERIAADRAASALERTARDAADEGAVVRCYAVVVGAFSGARLCPPSLTKSRDSRVTFDAKCTLAPRGSTRAHSSERST
jgi:hypothetical protein